MSYALPTNLRRLFRRPDTTTTAPPKAPMSTYEQNLQAHYALKDDGISKIAHLPDMERLLDILMLNRCADGFGIACLIRRYLMGAGFVDDDYGNRFFTIQQPDGSDPRIAFTAHCDTMSDDPDNTYHPLCYNQEKDILFRNDGNVLGADDGTGIWLLLNLIDARVPGLYCFYLDEESGRQGSTWSEQNQPERYEYIDTMISFDRKGTEDIIATQKGDPCCSLGFQQALADLMHDPVLGLKYITGARGSFTDSATFMERVPECTNLAVGYDRQHTPQETQLVMHAVKLRTHLMSAGHRFHAQLPVLRDPTPKPRAPVYQGGAPGWPNYSQEQQIMTQWGQDRAAEHDYDSLFDAAEISCLQHGTIADMVSDFPEATHSLLEDMGYTEDEVANYIAFILFGIEDIRSADTDT